jgi:hypothetical protein
MFAWKKGKMNYFFPNAGQVHRARLKGQEVVIKVQRPGLKDLFDIDLKNLRVSVKLYALCAYVTLLFDNFITLSLIYLITFSNLQKLTSLLLNM